MVTTNSKSKMIILLLLKDFSKTYTVTSLASQLEISRVGVWKILKKLQSEQFISITSIGSGKTSTFMVDLNWENVLVEKSLALYLTEESLKQKRWKVNFMELEGLVDFLLIYGGILHSPEKADDIDIISVVSDKKKFIKIQQTIDKIQRSQIKKIHAINFTRVEFRKELKEDNKAFIDAVRKGVVLSGQEKFIQFMKNIK